MNFLNDAEATADTMTEVFDPIPAYPARASGVQRRLEKHAGTTTDFDVHGKEKEKKKEESESESDEEEETTNASPAPDTAKVPEPIDIMAQFMDDSPAPPVVQASVQEDTAVLFPPQATLPVTAWGAPESQKTAIYESKVILAATQIRVADGTALINLLIRVRGPSALEQFTVVCPPDDLLNAVARVSSDTIPPQDEPSRVLIRIRCRKPFATTAAAVQLRFVYNGAPTAIVLKLPVHVSNYVTAATPNKEQFMGLWQRLIGDKQAQALVDVPVLLTAQQVVNRIQSCMGLASLPGIVDEKTLSCAGTFRSIGVVGSDTPITMPVTMMVQVHPTQSVLKVMIRSGHNLLSTNVMDAFVLLFRGSKRG
jgi:hypothetical protein